MGAVSTELWAAPRAADPVHATVTVPGSKSQTNRTLGKLNARSAQIKTAMTKTSELAKSIEGKNKEINEILAEANPATDVLSGQTQQIANLVVLAGATTKELMQFAGHSDIHVAMRYQEAVNDRKKDLAKRMAALAQPAVEE